MFEAHTPKEVAATLNGFHKDTLAGIIAIDGKDGAGKGCLAKNLQNLIGGSIVSLDCFLREKDRGGYVPYLDLAAIGAAIEGCAGPKIIEGCCVLEVFDSIKHKQDALIYAKRVMFYPDGSAYWLDDDLLHHREAVSEDDTVTKEIIQYHDTFDPLHIATIAFLHTYKELRCPFHL